ncbi:MAG: quinone oxidoreductase [Gemmatimonadota bacterium]|nr:quinone oxidoreductase [Gemmatimonadota bacterium]
MNTTRTVRIHALGGPEVLRWEEIPLSNPGPGEVLVRHEAVGLNFIDTYHRSGLYPVPSLPTAIGMEAAGVVEAVGPAGGDGERTGNSRPAGDGPSFQPGDRVAYGFGLGAYCERRVMPTGQLVPIPDGVDFETAAAAMLKGMTSWYLCRRTYRLGAGETVLVHAAAGGVGTILCQWCKALGATVIGTVGSAGKGDVAREHGCDHVILYKEEDFVERVDEITGGRGVPVVFDGVGKATFDGSMECLSRFGMMITFGNASGAVPPLNLLRLSAKGITVARPSLKPYIDRREDLEEAAGELLGHIEAGRIRITVGQRFPLAEAAEAHRALESRGTQGCTVLVP